jgi:hypothetical protein
MASIPLVALDVNTQPKQGPLQQYAEAQQIQAARTQQQTAQLQQTGLQQENQQRALQLQDQQTLRSLAPNHVQKDTNGNATGFDTEGMLQEAAAKGVSPQTINQMRLSYADTVSKLASADKSVRDNEAAKNKALYETLESVRDIKDPQQRQAALIQALPSLQKQGVDTSKIQTNQPVTDDQLNLSEAGLGMHSQMISDANKQSETAANQAKVTTANTEAQKFGTTLPGGTAENPEQKYIRLQSQQGQGQALSSADQSWVQGYEKNKKLVPMLSIAAASNTGAGKPAADVAKQFGMSPEAFDQAAEKYYSAGTLPPPGRGPAGPALGRAIMNRTAELHPGASLSEGSAEYKANSDSLKKIQSSFDSVAAFENTANKNLDLFTNLAQKAIDSGIPLINAPLRTAATMLGSQDQAALNTARQVAINEIAKVTSNPSLSGQLSDSARKEIEAFNPQSATVGQTMAVAKVLKQDMANRHQSYQEQIADIKGRIGGQGGANQNQNTNTPTRPPGTTHTGIGSVDKKKHYLDKDGNDLGVAE